MNRTIWIMAGIITGLLLLAGIAHMAFMSSAQLYLNMRETDEKQTAFMFQLEKRIDEIERKLAVFEQNLRFEAGIKK